jgi:hypothetical protein
MCASKVVLVEDLRFQATLKKDYSPFTATAPSTHPAPPPA